MDLLRPVDSILVVTLEQAVKASILRCASRGSRRLDASGGGGGGDDDDDAQPFA